MKHLLTLLLILFCFNVYGQIKIGTIEVDKETGTKYLLDCYLRPDTVKPKSFHDYIGCNNCVIQNEDLYKAKILAAEFNSVLEKMNIGQVWDTIYYEAYIDTVYDGGTILTSAGSSDEYKKKAKKIEIVNREGGSYIMWRGYLMPRKPTEIDFIKWLKTNNP